MNFTIQLAADGSHTIGMDAAGNTVNMYLPETAGGNATGIRPMQMLILGVGGCTAVDVLMILKKKRQIVEDFRIEITATRENDKEPALWESAHLKYYFKGEVDLEKAKHAIDLSISKYCSASETLRSAGSVITWEAFLM